jgi:hypothetical protein
MKALFACLVLCAAPVTAATVNPLLAPVAVPSPAQVQLWVGDAGRFFRDPNPKAEMLKQLFADLSNFDLKAAPVQAQLEPLRLRLASELKTMLPRKPWEDVGETAAEVERWAVMAGPLKDVLDAKSRGLIDGASKTQTLRNRMSDIARALSAGTFGWVDPAPLVKAMSGQKQNEYALLKRSQDYGERVVVKQFPVDISGRVENLRDKGGRVAFTVHGSHFFLDDAALVIEKFVSGSVDDAAKALNAAGRALLDQLKEARRLATTKTVSIAEFMTRNDLQATVVDVFAEHGKIFATISAYDPKAKRQVRRDVPLAEIFGIR